MQYIACSTSFNAVFNIIDLSGFSSLCCANTCIDNAVRKALVILDHLSLSKFPLIYAKVLSQT